MAQNKMLIDASHPEETRVVVVRGSRVEEFDFESENKTQIRGNIYLAKVTRVEPSLQAAFVDYGGNRHGFLAFSEIHPDYYQIPVADRQALLEEEAAAVKEEAEEEKEKEKEAKPAKRRRRSRRKPSAKKASEESAEENASGETEEGSNEKDGEGLVPEAKSQEDADAPATEREMASNEDEATDSDASDKPDSIAADNESDTISEPAGEDDDDDDDEDEDDGDDDDNGDDNENAVESVGVEDALEEVPVRRVKRRHYKIQEVIKRRQIILVQIVKEERGNKGAALTTYLSLAGRYSVLMPNTARGGGISRKITNLADRKRLKSIAGDLDVAEGMGVILRTAGASRTKPEIRRDFEYLLRLWENVRNLTLQSTAPCLVYEEGSLIKRSIRDLYDKDTGEIFVSGEEAYNEAKGFMSMLMPSHAKHVKRYTDRVPIFSRNGVEAQLDKMLQPQVTLKSGGYLVINQTEALVAIDVNSGRSTRQHSIEDTATQTNLEAAEEVARQLRLRDLAGLIVVDFIDMEEKRNNRAVEKRLKDALKNDRARIQVSRISHFGLLEMSRQRIRASVLESTTKTCPTCDGIGHVRSPSSIALHVLRTTEEYLLKASRHNLVVKTSAETAQYVLNYKRLNLVDLETRFGVLITIEIDPTIGNQFLLIERGDFATPRAQVENHVQPDSFWPEADDAASDEPDAVIDGADADENETRPKRKRRRSRRGRGRSNQGEENSNEATVSAEAAETVAAEDDSPAVEVAALDEGEAKPKRRRRGRRGGRNSNSDEATSAESSDEKSESTVNAAKIVDTVEVVVPAEPEAAEEKPGRNRRPGRGRKAKPAETPVEANDTADVAEEVTADTVETVEVMAEDTKKPPRRTSRRPRKKKTEEAVEATEATEVAPEKFDSVVETAPAEITTDEDKTPAKPRRNTKRKAASKTVAEANVAETSSDEGSEESDKDDGKKKKGGWWQRQSFF